MADPVLPPEVRAAWAAQSTARPARPALTLERIVEAGIRIADADGLAGLSMAKVAQELGSATMALYRHVPSKDVLLLHMQDAALESPPRERSDGLDWRGGLATWTRANLEIYVRRPWVLAIPIVGPPMMPKTVEWIDWALALMSGMALEPFEKLSTMMLLSGYARNEASLLAVIAAEPAIDGARADLEYETALRTLSGPDRFPAIHELVNSGGLFDVPPDAGTDDGDQFMLDFGLERILDGLAALMATRGSS